MQDRLKSKNIATENNSSLIFFFLSPSNVAELMEPSYLHFICFVGAFDKYMFLIIVIISPSKKEMARTPANSTSALICAFNLNERKTVQTYKLIKLFCFLP